jgi:RNA polymerase sigma factor (sigma-70 family)
MYEWVKISFFHTPITLKERDKMKNLTKMKNKRNFQKLMREIREHPDAGLEKFYNTYGKIVQVTARTICGSLSQADAVINTVLIKVWELSKENLAIDNPEGWVYVITANAAKDALRERTFMPLNESVADKRDEIQTLIDNDAFYSLISTLTEEEQKLMIDKFILQRTFKEIAEETGENINKISSMYYRAIEKVKNCLEEENGK